MAGGTPFPAPGASVIDQDVTSEPRLRLNVVLKVSCVFVHSPKEVEAILAPYTPAKLFETSPAAPLGVKDAHWASEPPSFLPHEEAEKPLEQP